MYLCFRRIAIFAMLLITGISLTYGAVYPETAIIMSMIGTFMSTGAFNIAYIQVYIL